MSDPSSILVSVVSPIYNMEPYLEECIRSVLAQTHENFEYLLVNNQSTDRSGQIAADYATQDSRIKVVTTPEFFPQVDNFNFTMRQIHEDSRYTKMLLSDDWLFPDALAKMVDLAARHPSVGIVGSHWFKGNDGCGFGIPVDREVFSGRDACRLHLVDGIYLFGTPSTLLYRSDLVRARAQFFRPGRIHFDTDTVFDQLASHDFGFVHQLLSYCRHRADSVTGAAAHFNPTALDRIVLLLNHGHSFLSPGEFEYCYRGALRFFYDGLARALVASPREFPDGKFWEFQRRGLATANTEINTRQLMLYVARYLAKAASNPLALAKEVRDQHLKRDRFAS